MTFRSRKFAFRPDGTELGCVLKQLPLSFGAGTSMRTYGSWGARSR